MTLNELTRKQRKITVISSLNKTAYKKTDINPNNVILDVTDFNHEIGGDSQIINICVRLVSYDEERESVIAIFRFIRIRFIYRQIKDILAYTRS